MNKFVATGSSIALETPVIGRITRSPLRDENSRTEHVLVATNTPIHHDDMRGYGAILTADSTESLPPGKEPFPPIVHSLQKLENFCEGDVVVVRPGRGKTGPSTVRAIYCINSRFSNLLLTEQCNSRCLMCSQPPKVEDDSYLVDEALKVIKLINKDAEVLGMTGGEPTLLKDRFFSLIQACRDNLPKTYLHVLTNGRFFVYKDFARKLAEIGHPDLMLGIPIYSDIADEHDYVVQAKGAFEQTLKGIYNLGSYGVNVEVRVVIHALTYERLPQLARFIFQNLPFVRHIALMGLEITGYTKKNLKELWIDPYDYQAQLVEAVEFLADRGMNVSVYNHQLCVIPKSIWSYARQSISDWKNIYLDECQPCAVLKKCGGLFKSAENVHSSHIRAFREGPALATAQASL